MGRYCACGVKKRDDWVCECDWKGWYKCWDEQENTPSEVPTKNIPDADGTYTVRVFDDSGDDHEEESEFSVVAKNWGQYCNRKISHWKIEYEDGWTGYVGVYAWTSNKTPNSLDAFAGILRGTLRNMNEKEATEISWIDLIATSPFPVHVLI